MNADTTKAMQDALDAAVRSLNNGGGGADSAPSRSADTIGAIMSILPKLLQGNEASEEVLEKLDSLQKGDITALKEQVLILRKQCHRVLKTQELVLAQLAEIDKRQSLMTDAILDLRDQLARVEIVEGPPDERGEGGERGERGNEARDAAPDSRGQGRRAPLETHKKRPQQKAAKNMTGARL